MLPKSAVMDTNTGVHPLDGTDANLNISRNEGGLQTANTVQFGEGTIVIIGAVCQKLSFSLLAQALGIHQKQHPVYAGMLQKAIHGGNGRKGLACASSHLDQGLGLVGRKGLFQISNSNFLTDPPPTVSSPPYLHPSSFCLLPVSRPVAHVFITSGLHSQASISVSVTYHCVTNHPKPILKQHQLLFTDHYEIGVKAQ